MAHGAPVAQLDRAPDFESVGRRFDSYRACQLTSCWGASGSSSAAPGSIARATNAYFRTKRFDEAIPMVQAICSDSPWQVKAISILGGCFYEQKKYDPTIEAWKNAPLQKRSAKSETRKRAERHLERIFAHDTHVQRRPKQVRGVGSVGISVSVRPRELRDTRRWGSPGSFLSVCAFGLSGASRRQNAVDGRATSGKASVSFCRRARQTGPVVDVSGTPFYGF